MKPNREGWFHGTCYQAAFVKLAEKAADQKNTGQNHRYRTGRRLQSKSADLLDWTLEQERQQFLSNNDFSEDSLKNLDILLDHLRANKTFILNTYHSLAHPLLEKTLKNDIRPLVEIAVSRYTEESSINEADKALIIRLYTLAFVGILREWLDNDLDENYDLDFKRWLPMLHRSLQFNIGQLSD